MAVTRPQWRDAIKADPRLSAKDKLVALLMADFWKADSPQPIWAATEVIMEQGTLSRASVFRATKNLHDVGYLRQVEQARHGRAPRWLPTLPETPSETLPERGALRGPGTPFRSTHGTLVDGSVNVDQSHSETDQSLSETNQSLSDVGDHTYTTRSPHLPSPRASMDATPQAPLAASPPQAESTPRKRARPKRKITPLQDRRIWRETLNQYGDLDDYGPAEIEEIYLHWKTRFRTPGCWARWMSQDHRLDGFLGGAGIELGLYDEAEYPDFDEYEYA